METTWKLSPNSLAISITYNLPIFEESIGSIKLYSYYINVMKTIYFIMNSFIQLSCMFLGWNTVNEFYLKPVKVKSKNRPNR